MILLEANPATGYKSEPHAPLLHAHRLLFGHISRHMYVENS